jgi:transposase
MEADKDKNANEPGCLGCAARDKKIAELEARLGKLEALVRTGKRQAAPFSKGPPKGDPKPPGRKSGEDYGAHHRRPIPERIDEVHEAALPVCCPHCAGTHIIETGVAQQYQTEIPRKTIHRQFNVHIGQCVDCEARVQGRHLLQTSDALGACASQIGPDAQALAAMLNKDAGLSHGKVKGFFNWAFDLDLSRGGACRTMLRVARRCEPAYEAIVRRVRLSPLIVPDETGWRIGGLPAWLHVAVACDATAYLVHRRRGYEAAVELIGADYEGFMTHDGWSPYERFIYATHQTCLSHLLRRGRELLDNARGGAVRLPRQVKAILQEALTVRDRRDAGELTAQEAIEEAIGFASRLGELTARPRTHAENERFAKHLWNRRESLFTFLQFPGVDPTNYRAEQAIRPATVNRKVWGGNRTEIGATAQSVLMSVLRTARQRGIAALNFISATLKSPFAEQPQLIVDTG